MTLLQETLHVMSVLGISGPTYVDSGEISFTWTEFEKIADFEYAKDQGTPIINPTLRIVKKDEWMLVRKYDDANEWWDVEYLIKAPQGTPAKADLLCSDPGR